MKSVVVIIGLVASALAMPRQSLRLRDVDPCDFNGQTCDPEDDAFPQCCYNLVSLAKCDEQADGSYKVDIQGCGATGCASSDSGDHCQSPE